MISYDTRMLSEVVNALGYKQEIFGTSLNASRSPNVRL
jgi:hypothetical protein